MGTFTQNQLMTKFELKNQRERRYLNFSQNVYIIVS